jgi:hypothetical protein
MAKVIYQIVQHDDGWAYRVGDVYSETFATHDEAFAAADAAAKKQHAAGETTAISYEDPAGRWHREVAEGTDRPETKVQDEHS